jgi:hypothetical protein
VWGNYVNSFFFFSFPAWQSDESSLIALLGTYLVNHGIPGTPSTLASFFLQARNWTIKLSQSPQFPPVYRQCEPFLELPKPRKLEN